ncbi:lipid II flippase MurJ [Helicobacter sp. 23-1044]
MGFKEILRGNSSLGNHCVDSANQTKITEFEKDSSLRASEASVAIQDSANAESSEIQSCEAPKTRPLRGAKNRIEGCSSATADFLLEADKRGSPPKSEKRQLLASRGSGAGGAALLREKTSELNPKNGENLVDSANETQNAESHIKAQNLNRDSSLVSLAQNDKTIDCHDFAMQNLAMTKSNADSALHTKNAESSLKNAPRGSIVDEKSGLRSCERGDRTNGSLTKRTTKQGEAEVSLFSLPDLSPQDNRTNIKSFFAQFFPALLGSSTAQIASFIDTLLASFLVSGSVSYLYYANRIFQLPLALFAIATSTALFPMVAKALRNGNESQSLQLLTKGFWLLIFALSVCVVGGIMLKDEIIWLLFERGKFTRTDTLAVANVFMAYLIGLLPYGLARIFALWLYSLKRQAQAAKISAISLFCGVLCSIVLMQFFGAFGLALSSSVAGFILFALTIRAFGFAKFRKIIAKPKFFVYLIILLCVECGILFLVKTILGEFYAVV